MGSNKGIKKKVAEGKLCYICEKATPTRVDEVNGHICTECDNAIQAIRLQYALQDGYRLKEGTARL